MGKRRVINHNITKQSVNYVAISGYISYVGWGNEMYYILLTIYNILYNIKWAHFRLTIDTSWSRKNLGYILWYFTWWDDVIKWKHFSRYWPFVRGIHRSPVNSPHKGQWRGALMFSLICAWINGWVNDREAGDLRRHHTHHDVTIYNEYLRKCKNAKMSICKLNYAKQSLHALYIVCGRCGSHSLNGISFWWNFRQWLQRKSSFSQL